MSSADDPLVHELTVLAMRSRQLAALSVYPELRRQLALLADDYEAVLASVLGARLKLGDEPLNG